MRLRALTVVVENFEAVETPAEVVYSEKVDCESHVYKSLPNSSHKNNLFFCCGEFDVNVLKKNFET